MIDPNVLDQLTKRLSDTLPDSVKLLQTDIEKNFKAVLQSLFAEMDLVSREEFDLQTALLKRSNEKLKELEQKLFELERNNT